MARTPPPLPKDEGTGAMIRSLGLGLGVCHWRKKRGKDNFKASVGQSLLQQVLSVLRIRVFYKLTLKEYRI